MMKSDTMRKRVKNINEFAQLESLLRFFSAFLKVL